MRKPYALDDWQDYRHCTYWVWRQAWAAITVCSKVGHDWYPDLCGRPEHDLCARCEEVRDHARPMSVWEACRWLWGAVRATADGLLP